jgi:hypothetical protein
MAFIMCDDHDVSVESDDVDEARAKQLMLGDSTAGASAAEKEIIAFGNAHRHCNIRILPG